MFIRHPFSWQRSKTRRAVPAKISRGCRHLSEDSRECRCWLADSSRRTLFGWIMAAGGDPDMKQTWLLDSTSPEKWVGSTETSTRTLAEAKGLTAEARHLPRASREVEEGNCRFPGRPSPGPGPRAFPKTASLVLMLTRPHTQGFLKTWRFLPSFSSETSRWHWAAYLRPPGPHPAVGDGPWGDDIISSVRMGLCVSGSYQMFWSKS